MAEDYSANGLLRQLRDRTPATGPKTAANSSAVVPPSDQAWDILLATSDLTGARVNIASSGDNTIVAATASQTTRVHRLKLSAAGAVIVQIKDGATVLDVFNFAGNGGGTVLDFSSRPWYITTANTALVFNLSAAVQIDGRIEYVKS